MDYVGRVLINGEVLFDGTFSSGLGLQHGTPFGGIFGNWEQAHFLVGSRTAQRFIVAIENNTAGGGGPWIAIDDLELRLRDSSTCTLARAVGTPGAPRLIRTSATPNDGRFDLGWDAAAAADDVRYALQHRDANDSAVAPLDGASTLTVARFGFADSAREAEGTWRYRVRARVTADAIESAFSEQSEPVKIDRTPPTRPATSARAPDYDPPGEQTTGTATP